MLWNPITWSIPTLLTGNAEIFLKIYIKVGVFEYVLTRYYVSHHVS